MQSIAALSHISIDNYLLDVFTKFLLSINIHRSIWWAHLLSEVKKKQKTQHCQTPGLRLNLCQCFMALCTHTYTHIHLDTQWALKDKHSLCCLSKVSVITCTSAGQMDNSEKRRRMFRYNATLYMQPSSVISAAITFLCKHALIVRPLCLGPLWFKDRTTQTLKENMPLSSAAPTGIRTSNP